ncbi:preprotein translocase subunit SecG [Treponema phagedenis]|uniref:Protein-export membrane protein SecG n=1 Tax=Treponema phagedenis TaxID=162 RepID=A0A0B7GQC7_TREPH|nr:preprotein translocase subunit SecG [Treponema phagedenis]NVP24570.1 preprotein translocase subunit SecG [Treponema phagedenis]QEJ94733.1 preprotein translocase subunit SecG [Treponema phagedenis]QEJ97669.1 preprotein translocase subunit SecG [Treponema phagedenis]QEK00638.1 preprotein translocase subunit SecG [Treponema phagedenis]QEK03238.1 preprotein translocase subunit SecG [Treponema phagedenis]
MSAISIVLLVFFVIICFLLVGLVLLQNEEGDSLGGLFAGGSNSAFGSRSGNILTKTTYVLLALFFVTTFFLAWLNKSPAIDDLQKAAQQQQTETATEWWKDNDTNQPDAAKPAEQTTPKAESEAGAGK